MIVFARRWGCSERNKAHRWLWVPDRRSRCSLVRDDADGFNFQNSRRICVGILAARIAPEFLRLSPSKTEGAGNAGCAAPAVSCANCTEKAHTSIQVQRRQSGIPCAMALRLMPCSPRRRIRLVTVVSGLMARQSPVGPTCLRKLGASNGRQDHTVLPYATRLRQEASPGLVPVRRSFCESGSSAVRPARRCSLTEDRPANKPAAPDAAASTASHPAFVTIAIRPSWGMRWRELIALICPTAIVQYFCERDWTTQIALKLQRKSKFARNVFSRPSSSRATPDAD
jgi:hypothetical protein